ncbi:MAG: DUF6279 family lipoprotein [Bdellovibrio sp.]
MKKHLGFLILLFLAIGCSRSDIMYRFADTMAVSKTDDYFDLSSAQKKELKKDIQTDLEKMRKELLPQVAKSLRSVETQVGKGPLPEDFVADHVESAQTYFKKGTHYFSDTAVKLTASLDSTQISHFAKKVRKDIEKRQDPDEANKELNKRYRRSLELWIGGLSKDQKESLKKFQSSHPYPFHLQAQSREYVLQKFLESSKDPQTMKNFVQQFTSDYESVRQPAYDQALQSYQKDFQKFLTGPFWSSLSTVQKEVFKKNLLTRAEELEKLSQRP